MPTTYPPDTVLRVPPFQHRLEGDAVTIGATDRHVFLSVPAPALDILQDLAAGHSIGDTARRYEERTGREVDIDGFVAALEAEGFVRDEADEAVVETAKSDRYTGHLDWISQRTAQRFTSRPVVWLSLLLVAGAVALVVADPGVMPSFQALIYPRHLAILTWITFGIGFATTMLHEFAHAIAARAAGIPSRIRLSNRLFIPVLETDMTGIQLAPKRARYLAYLSGPLLDSASVAVFIGILYAQRHGILDVPAIPLLVLKGVTVTYIGRIYWQVFLFVRTDLYYTLATALNCKSLMADTQDFLENTVRRLTFRKPLIDQSGLPRNERRTVRWYAILWVIGRAFALLLLFWVTIPVLGHHLATIWDYLTNPATIWSGFDFLTSVVLSAAFTAVGLYLWGRTLARGVARRVAARRLRLAQAATA